jgi:TonB family protein
MRSGTIGLIATVALAAPVFGLAQNPAPYDVAATWLRQPSAEDVQAARPLVAIREGLDGRASVRCLVTLQGALTSCQVLSEKPEGKGFGEAALTLTPSFQLKPATKAGKPVESWVSFSVNMSGQGGRPTDSFIPGTTTAGMTRIVHNIPWVATPTFEQMAAAYPAKAKAAGKTGRATLHCRFNAEGALTFCRPSQEEPVGQGFGAAARELVSTFKAPQKLPDGTPLERAEIELPFTFDETMLKGQRKPMARPAWISQPNAEVMRAAFPMQAMAADVGKGRVVLGCVVGADGELSGCKIESEDPLGLGFAAAAMAAVHHYRVRSWTEEGTPTIGQAIHLAIGYDLPPKELAELKLMRGFPQAPKSGAN